MSQTHVIISFFQRCFKHLLLADGACRRECWIHCVQARASLGLAAPKVACRLLPSLNFRNRVCTRLEPIDSHTDSWDYIHVERETYKHIYIYIYRVKPCAKYGGDLKRENIQDVPNTCQSHVFQRCFKHLLLADGACRRECWIHCVQARAGLVWNIILIFRSILYEF